MKYKAKFTIQSFSIKIDMFLKESWSLDFLPAEVHKNFVSIRWDQSQAWDLVLRFLSGSPVHHTSMSDVCRQ